MPSPKFTGMRIPTTNSKINLPIFIIFTGMLALSLFACVLSVYGSVQGSLSESHSSDVIKNYVNSFGVAKAVGQGLCDGATCCNVTSTELCSISAMPKDQSTLVLPGGDTRCIYSYSTPFAFQVIRGSTISTSAISLNFCFLIHLLAGYSW